MADANPPGLDESGLNEYGALERVALRHPRAAFGGPKISVKGTGGPTCLTRPLVRS